MKKFVFVIFIFSSVMCALTNCSLPIGSIESYNSQDEIEAMWLIPHQQLYEIDDKFKRDKDFQLFVVEKGGRVAEILPDPTFPDVGAIVSITGNIGQSTEFVEEMKTDTHSLHQTGLHKITVSYLNKTSYYIIEVITSSNGNSLSGDDGIGIIWLD